jgi:ParB family chromosome partitioning protein
MAQTPKRGLGRGFEALLPADFDKQLVLNDDERIQKIPLSDIVANEEQPRRYFDTDGLNDLAESIRTHGILLPLVLTKLPNGKLQIVAGERRFRAAKLAGLSKVPGVVRSMQDLEQLEISLVENIQRVDLSPLEQALTLQRLHEQFSTSYDSIAKRVGKAPSTVNNIVRLLQLPKDAQVALTEHTISEGHARAILALKDKPDLQAALLRAITAQGWSVRQAERYVTSHKEAAGDTEAVKARMATETPQTKALATRLKTQVHVKRMAKGGRLEIGFRSDDELSRIINQLNAN